MSRHRPRNRKRSGNLSLTTIILGFLVVVWLVDTYGK